MTFYHKAEIFWVKKDPKSEKSERFFYVIANGSESTIKVTLHGIVQGSILRPILYAIFNALGNRLHFMNDLIPLSWLNLSLGSFKIGFKKLLLKM